VQYVCQLYHLGEPPAQAASAGTASGLDLLGVPVDTGGRSHYNGANCAHERVRHRIGGEMSSKRYFDQIAQQWDHMREGFFSEAVRRKALAVAGARPGQIAADIGAGSGFVTEGLVQEGLRVIAVDQSEAMLEEMRRKFSHLDTVQYRVGQGDSLPLEDEAVDYVFANMYLHHVESPARAIGEMVRILKPGGKVVITDLDEHAFEFLRTEQQDRWLGFPRERVEGWLREAGLARVATDCVGEDCCANSESGPRAASVSIFVAYGEKEGPASARETREGGGK
jgi:ubiquinone/menaquinone biosynthesis C-methylase UbiE